MLIHIRYLNTVTVRISFVSKQTKGKATKLDRARPQGQNCTAMAQLCMPMAIYNSCWPTENLPVNSDY